MMPTSLLYTNTVSGHHLEYLHHLYDACLRMTDRQFVFVVPEQFVTVRHQFEWAEAQHITFDYLTVAEAAACTQGGMLACSWRICRVVKRRIKKHKADRVFAITLMAHLPFAPFVYGRKVKLSGIIYKIYLYEWKAASWLRRAMDVLKYGLMRTFGCFDRIFILNDRAAARRLNRIYRTTKFHYLPDPYVGLPQAAERNQTRRELGLAEDQRLLFHFGALAERKGTMRIVESLAHLDEEQCRRYVFLFAGRVQADIREAFYAGVEAQKGRVRVIVEDDFCSYERLASLCAASDLLLMPYLETAQSSGVIGYASQFGTPVLASDRGLIGKLVRRYGLGYRTSVDPEALAAAYRQHTHDAKVCSSEYVTAHRVSAFQSELKEIL